MSKYSTFAGNGVQRYARIKWNRTPRKGAYDRTGIRAVPDD
jgi:hypothetical protein